MKLIFVIATILATWAMTASGNLPENPEEYKKWEIESLGAIKAQQHVPAVEAIPKLGRWVVKFSEGMNYEKNDRPVFHAAQEALLSIPGHARYYQDKIDKMRDELLENSKKTQEELIKMQDAGQTVLDEPTYLSEVGLAIRTLKFMPSAETVSVLGYFLNDPVLRDGKTLLGNRLIPGDYEPHRSNAHLATEVIRQLGIEQPPFRDSKGTITPDEIDAWKDWWNEVKAGKRTYRFIGSEIEYGPDGPANKQAVQRNDFNRKREDERTTGHKQATPSSEAAQSNNSPTPSSSIFGIIAACILLAGAVWYLIRGKKTA